MGCSSSRITNRSKSSLSMSPTGTVSLAPSGRMCSRAASNFIISATELADLAERSGDVDVDDVDVMDAKSGSLGTALVSGVFNAWSDLGVVRGLLSFSSIPFSKMIILVSAQLGKMQRMHTEKFFV